ncbi:MAG: hypothetical protein WA159_19980 [Variovorax sp.]
MAVQWAALALLARLQLDPFAHHFHFVARSAGQRAQRVVEGVVEFRSL